MEFTIPQNVIDWQELLEDNFSSSENDRVVYTGITYTDILTVSKNEKIKLFEDLCSKFGNIIYLIDKQKSDSKFVDRSYIVGTQQGEAHNVEKLKADLLSDEIKKRYGFVFNDMLATLSQIKLISFQRDETKYKPPVQARISKNHESNSLSFGLASIKFHDLDLAEIRVRIEEDERNIKADLLEQLKRLGDYIQKNIGVLPRNEDFVRWFFNNSPINKLGKNLRKISDKDLLKYTQEYKRELDKIKEEFEEKELIKSILTMTLEELKNQVRTLIGKAKTKDAMNLVATWAHENNQEQLKSYISLLKGELTDLNRDKTLGLLSNSEATIRQNQLNNKLLNLVNAIVEKGSNPISDKVTPSVKSKEKEGDKPKIYFSYAWGDDHETGESREKIVGDLYESLKNDGFDVFRDKEDSGYKDLISDLMKDIGRGQFIVVAISDKYLKSPNCMFEMYEIYRNSKLEKDKFIEKIYPIRVESIRLSDPKVLDTYFEHWEQQEKEWADLIIKRGTRISPAQQERYKRIKSIASELGEFLELLSDINSKTKEDLSQNNFEAIKEAIKKRGNGN